MSEAATAAGGSWTVWNQLGIQALAVGIAVAYAAVMTFVIIYLLNKVIPFKSTEEEEMTGLDKAYHGERGYGMLNAN